MFKQKHLRTITTLCVIFISCCWSSRAFTSDEQKSIFSDSTNETMKISVHPKSSTGTAKITGKVMNTAREPLSDITISIQSVSKITPYGTAFKDVTTTNEKGKFRINNLGTGTYAIRAKPLSDDSYLPNDTIININEKERLNRVRLKLSPSTPPGALYVGSKVCLGCHPEYKKWEKTAHANSIRTNLSENTVMAPFNGKIITTSDGKVKFKPFVQDNTYKVTLYDLKNESISVTYTPVRTHGGWARAGKQRYHVKMGKSHYMLPIQYNSKNVDENNPNDAWVSYNPGHWYNSEGSLITTDVNTPSSPRSFEQYCEGCHAAGLGIAPTSDGQFVSYTKELKISCESCHGPGGDHVSKNLLGDTIGDFKGNIVHPEYLAADRANEVCGYCHSRVKNKTGESGSDFETEYPCIVDGGEVIPFIPGKVLADYIEETKSDGKSTADYWNDNDSTLLGANASGNNHSYSHHQQLQDFTKSTHYHIDAMKCIDCHEPHDGGIKGTAQLLRKNANNKTCTTPLCHPSYAKTEKKNGKMWNTHAKHYYSRSDAGGSLCTSCHMPRTAKSGVYNDISSHFINDIIKPSTSKAMADNNTAEGKTNNSSTVIINSCYSNVCHPEETDYGVELWNRWSIHRIE